MNRPFNEQKYKSLLEGLEVSEINSTYFIKENPEFRLDAEYFSKENIVNLDVLYRIGYKEIGKFCYVTDGIHTSIDYCDNSSVNLFSATTPRENYFDLSRKAFISEKSHNQNPRTALQENDIIISTVGTIGNCAVVDKSVLPANSDRHVGIIRVQDNEFYPRYISTFLLTKYGKFQTYRESTGNVQLNLFIYRIKTLKIANLSNDFQKIIEDSVLLSDSKRLGAKQLYSQAEQLLLSELGLQNWQPTTENINEKSFKDSFLTTGRLDAEYYQPKYEEILSCVNKFGTKELGKIVSISKSIEPGSEAYQDSGIPFIRVSNISKFGLSDTDIFLNRDKYENDLLKPKKDTILLTKDGSVGIAYKVEKDLDAITSGALLHLKIADNDFLPDYLTLILNSIVVKLQSERDSGGSIIQHWKPSEIEQVIIPKINFETQQQIGELIQESFALKQQSEHLLEVAKRAVEIAIEEDEGTAMEYLSENIKNGIEL